MGAHSKIEWTDHTFNAWIGCAHVHAGCTNCYAESFAKRTGKAKWGPQGTRVKTSESYWRQPLKWNREAEATGVRRRVFCASLADVFEDYRLPIIDHHGRQLFLQGGKTCGQNIYGLGMDGGRQATLDDLRHDLFDLIDFTPWLDWLLLTKRPENVRRMWDYSRRLKNGRASQNQGDNIDVFRPNVWLGTSVSDQETADRLIPELLRCRDLAPVLFVSAEPLLGPINMRGRPPAGRGCCLIDHRHDGSQGRCQNGGLDWVIAGGESGPHARPMHPDWPRSLRDQCQAAGVPFFFKQWGEWLPGLQDGGRMPNGSQVINCSDLPDRVGKTAAGRLLDGREWNELPLRTGSPSEAMFHKSKRSQ